MPRLDACGKAGANQRAIQNTKSKQMFTKHAEAVSLYFLESDIDVAFSYLHLAALANGQGAEGRAIRLIGKALTIQKLVLRDLDAIPDTFGQRKRDLAGRAAELLQIAALQISDFPTPITPA